MDYERAEGIAARLPDSLRHIRAWALLATGRGPGGGEVECPCCGGVGHLGDVTRRCPFCLGWLKVGMVLANWYEETGLAPAEGRPATPTVSGPRGWRSSEDRTYRRHSGRMGDTGGVKMTATRVLNGGAGQ